MTLMMPPQSNPPGSEVIVHSPNGHSPKGPALVCNVWSPLPFAHPALIAIVPANGSAQSLAYATQVARDFTRALISLYSAARPAGCPNNNLLTCRGHSQTASKRVLVLVGDGSPTVDAYHAIGFWQTNAANAGYAFLPVCPNGAAPAMQTGIQAPLDQIKIREWDKSPGEIVPDIFRSAGLVSSDYRVFISYRQKDAGYYAEQLFAALARRGYDVFLDRVRIAFGGSIPESIEEELMHKSVLLVLETSKVHLSTWVIREIAAAATNRLAILALNFPKAPHLPVLSNRRRLTLSPADLTAGKRLNAAALKHICDRVAALQDFWLTRRRFQLQSSLSKVLARKGITNQQFTAEGHLNVVPHWAPQTVCSIGVSPRLPEIGDFRGLDHSLAPPQMWQRSIVARGAVSHGRWQSDIRWLADNAGAPWYDEGELPLLASRLASKNRPADGLKR